MVSHSPFLFSRFSRILAAMFCVLLLLSSLSFSAPSSPASWQAEARLMTGAGGSEGARALKRLQRFPGLDEELRRALTTGDRFLAVDVIGNLHRDSLLEELVDFSKRDETGFSYLALTAFIDQKTSPRFQKLFRSRLDSPSTPATGKIIMLDTLSRMGMDLSENEMQKLLSDKDSPEVQSGALRFLRARLLRRSEEKDLHLLEFALRAPYISRQQLVQALFLVSELKLAKIAAPGLNCPEDLPQRIANSCRKLRGGP